MRKLYLLLFVFCSLTAAAHSSCSNCDLYFVENKGQWNKKINFKSDFNNGAIFFENDRVTFALCNADQKNRAIGHGLEKRKKLPSDYLVDFHAYQMIFENSSSQKTMEQEEELNEYFNYFLGNNKNAWKGGCHAFRKVIYKNLYDGIDAEYYSEGLGLKYDLYVKAKTDVAQISIRYEGIENLRLDKEGDLILPSSVGEIIEQRPYAYQIIDGQKKEVKCRFVLNTETKTIQFKTEDYDENYTLVIDPRLIFATYSGSTTDNFGYTATYDKYGNGYAAGSAFGKGYPTTLGAYQINYIGGPTVVFSNGGTYPNTDMGITKYDSSGTSRIYSTFLGGYGSDLPHSLIVDKDDHLYVLGTTSSKDFPYTIAAYDTVFHGGPNMGPLDGIAVEYFQGSDIVISKFSVDGTQLLASTFLGDSANDGLNYNNPFASLDSALTRHNYADEVRGEIDIAPDGNIVIASTTRSKNFPKTNTLFSASNNGDADACLTKLTPDLDSLIWSIKFGGSGDDAAYSVAFALDSSIYVAGGTASANFPVPGLGKQKIYGGGKTDGFVYHIGKNADTILQTTFQGFNAYDQIYFVETNRKGEVFVFGQGDNSQSNYIFNATYNKPNAGQFITKFKTDLSGWIWSTSFGRGVGVSDISPTAFLVDLCNSIYVSGWGSENVNREAGWQSNVMGTTGLDVTPGCYKPTTDGADFYLMVMRDDASGLQYATFVGGNGGPAGDHVDGGTSRFDRKGVVYQSVCESCGGNSNFPTFPANCVSPTNKSNNCNNLLFKFDLDIPLTIADFSVPKACNGTKIPFTNLSKRVSSVVQYFWDFGDGDTSNLDNPIHTYLAPGTYIVKLKLIDSSSCNLNDSTQQTIVIQKAKSSTLPTVTICNSDSAQIGITPSSDPNATYSWTPPTFLNNPTISNPFSSANKNTFYKLFYNHDYCVDTFAQQVNVFFDSIKVTGGKILCPKDTVRLFATNGVSGNTFTYSWTPASQIIFGANTANPLCAPIKDTTFIVTATDTRGCVYKDSFFVKVASPLGSIASIAIPDTINFGDTSQIQTTYPPEAVRFQWDNAITLTAIDTPNPKAFPKETTTYTLTTEDSNGCRLKSDVKIVVLRKPCASSNIYVPNAFSPNNDGKNDVLYLRGNFIQTIYFAVYDRWGQLVFETRDQNKGWDGVFKNSKLDPAVFGYYAEGTCVGDEKFFKKGNVTLLK